MMIDQICREINNYFVVDKIFDNFTIVDGNIDLPLQEGQYFRIIGSIFNDGVYQYGEELDLKDETFDGSIWAMAVPNQVIALSEEINQWIIDNSVALSTPYQSESFGGYSYSLKNGGQSDGNNELTWQSHFASRLNAWRKAECRY